MANNAPTSIDLSHEHLTETEHANQFSGLEEKHKSASR